MREGREILASDRHQSRGGLSHLRHRVVTDLNKSGFVISLQVFDFSLVYSQRVCMCVTLCVCVGVCVLQCGIGLAVF